ncbi:MAG: hypothetical protein KC776_27850 [Myxococcales bacterium]|nr:hypothetical protein [Myxococcales bacterium]MCB9577622.1 hypothetical protein [Polyangiaceae bacterium]
MTDEAEETPTPDAPEREKRAANEFLAMGLSVGAVGAAGAVLLGATCPLCVVATPALIGVGLVRRVRAARMASRAGSVTDSEAQSPSGGEDEPTRG